MGALAGVGRGFHTGRTLADAGTPSLVLAGNDEAHPLLVSEGAGEAASDDRIASSP